ncbi:FIMAH domain-containing protein [Arthrobacter sp. Leaf137]|uniref:FIMAH domain-containing protein n=1 Tax=Arthrobacter sp. Leaf137 TaxID=1736271 RepID=UPI0006F3F4B0|nr:hypothetical protein [Arthrobacter sp. Leaf137]KQQ82714.1 hypothetical protein ASF64_08985 [Arthrobacter sp. Leaf137]
MTLGQHGALTVRWSATLLAAGLLAGCGTGETGLQRDAARQLQARVLEVTQATSQNNPATALRALEGLEAELEDAQSRGGISDERRRSITTIAAAVRADLTDAMAKTEQAKARAEEEARQAAEQAAAQTPPAQEAPAPSTVQPSGEDKGKKDNQGKGKDSG